MVQWLDLPVGLENKIYQYIDDDNLKLHNFLLMSKNWWKSNLGVTRYQLGTIILRPMGFPYRLYKRQLGRNFSTVMKLANHPTEHNISPDQYKYVEKPTDIRRFAPINSQVSKVLLQQFMNNGFQLDK